jgi:hypothetical protein
MKQFRESSFHQLHVINSMQHHLHNERLWKKNRSDGGHCSIPVITEPQSTERQIRAPVPSSGFGRKWRGHTGSSVARLFRILQRSRYLKITCSIKHCIARRDITNSAARGLKRENLYSQADKVRTVPYRAEIHDRRVHFSWTPATGPVQVLACTAPGQALHCPEMV